MARYAALAACLGMILSLTQAAMAGPRGFGFAQHGSSHPAPAPRPAPAPHAQPQAQRQQQGHPQQPARPQQPANAGRNQPGYPPAPQSGVRPGVRPGVQPNQRPWTGPSIGPAPALGPSNRPNTGAGRPVYNGQVTSRPGQQSGTHLPDWMAQHRNEPVTQQERQLRQEPGFNRLSPGEQQRAIQQLHQIDQMPQAQRDRRLARAEAIERLSPSERMQVNQSSRQMAALPADRQQMVRRAFRDLRGVPVDQRQTVLNSARYGATFSPEERGILSNLLRVEPYEAPH